MKKIILTFLIVISTISHAQLVEIIPDSISVNLDMVETGGVHTVMMDNIAYSNHSKLRKADARALELKTQYPNSEVYVTSPNATPTSSFKVFIDESKLNPQVDLSEILAKIDTLEIANELKGLAWNDLVTNVIPELERKIAFSDSLNSMKINILQKRIDTLQTFIRDSIAFITELEIDYSPPILKGFDYDTTGWLVDAQNGIYTYEDIIDLRYIVFTFNRPMVVGETYRISFDIVADGNANFSIWLYENPDDDIVEGYSNGRISDELTYSTGSYSYDYTVEFMDRIRLGIRARFYGTPFTMSNIEIIKL